MFKLPIFIINIVLSIFILVLMSYNYLSSFWELVSIILVGGFISGMATPEKSLYFHLKSTLFSAAMFGLLLGLLSFSHALITDARFDAVRGIGLYRLISFLMFMLTISVSAMAVYFYGSLASIILKGMKERLKII